MARVKYYDQASQEWKYADAALNMKGYTPIKGTDYFTDDDKRELTEEIMGQGVLTYNEQELTEDQKAQARENIGIDRISFNELTEDLDAKQFRITNLPEPKDGSDAATMEFVEKHTIEGSTYVARDDGNGNVTIKPYSADEDELFFKSHIENQNNPHSVTAAQVGARPDTWMPTAAEVGATPASHATDKNNPHSVTAEQVGAATPEEVSAAVKKAAPRNLLDNSDFRNPVNQRGYVSGTIGAADYVIDRWWLQYNTYLHLYSDCIGISGQWSLSQRVGSRIEAGKTYTFAVKARGETGAESLKYGFILNGTEAATKQIFYNLGTAWNIYLVSYTPSEDCDVGTVEVMFAISTGNEQTTKTFVQWAALYEGEYTIDTLPEYQPKGYGAELTECQRYYQVFESGQAAISAKHGHFNIMLNLPVPMRAIPVANINPGDILSANCYGVGEVQCNMKYVGITKYKWDVTGEVIADDTSGYENRLLIFDVAITLDAEFHKEELK